MKTSDWITLLGAVVAAIAIAVSASIALIAVKVQRNQAEIQRSQATTEQQQAQEDSKKELATVAQALASKVAQLVMGPVAAPDSATASASSEVMGLVIRANELVDVSSSVTWYLHYSLALAYGWLWEISKAGANWKKALAHADTAHTQVLVLIGEAVFQYSIGSIEVGRGCYSQAEEILKKNFPGDLGMDQLAYVLAQRALQEYGADQRNESARIYAEAWQGCQTMTTVWRRRRASWAVSNSFLQTFSQEQTPPPDTIPAGLVAFSTTFWQQQTQGVPPFGPQAAQAAQSFMQQPPVLQDGGIQAVNQQPVDPS